VMTRPEREQKRRISVILLPLLLVLFRYRRINSGYTSTPLSLCLCRLFLLSISSALLSDVQHCERCVPPMRFSMLVRRHHCRACNAAVCSACSPLHARVLVPGWGSQPQRVCLRCPAISAAQATAVSATDSANTTDSTPKAANAAAMTSASTVSSTHSSPRKNTTSGSSTTAAAAVAATAAAIATSNSTNSLSQSGGDVRGGALRELSYGVQLTNRMSYYVADQFLWLGMRGMVSCARPKVNFRRLN